TRWGNSKNTRGSYCFIKVGASVSDVETLGQPLNNAQGQCSLRPQSKRQSPCVMRNQDNISSPAETITQNTSDVGLDQEQGLRGSRINSSDVGQASARLGRGVQGPHTASSQVNEKQEIPEVPVEASTENSNDSVDLPDLLSKSQTGADESVISAVRDVELEAGGERVVASQSSEAVPTQKKKRKNKRNKQRANRRLKGKKEAATSPRTKRPRRASATITAPTDNMDEPIFVEDQPSIIDLVGSSEAPLPSHRRGQGTIPAIDLSDEDDDELPNVIPYNPPPTTPSPTQTGARTVMSPEAVKISCPICLDDDKAIKQGKKQFMSTACGHIFCRPCLEEAVNNFHQCPLCRKKTSRKNIFVLHI
ncbi:RNF4-like protein, partial [Mya arenaria]